MSRNYTMASERRGKTVKSGKVDTPAAHEDGPAAVARDADCIEAIVRRAIKTELDIFQTDIER